MKLAVIPARGGSKRIPRKNIKLFCGKPMIAWSIDAALRSNCFDKVIVSTEDQEIAEVAKMHGATVPFMRPLHLADDYTGTIPVVRHAIGWFKQSGNLPSQICCIYATAPFLKPEDLIRGQQLLEGNNCSYAFSVTSYPFPIQRAIRITNQGRVAMLHPEHYNTRSQDLEETWHDAAQFYWGNERGWMEESSFFTTASVPVCLPRHLVQDIDTPEDWERAEWMFRAMQLQQE